MWDVRADQLKDVSVVLATTFSVVAVAYYSATRSLADNAATAALDPQDLTYHIPVPKALVRSSVTRWLLKITSGTPVSEERPFMVMDEGFRQAADRNFLLYFPLGLLSAIGSLVWDQPWLVSVSIVLTQVTVNLLVFFSTQISAVNLLASRLVKEGNGFRPFIIVPPSLEAQYRPFWILIRTASVLFVLFGLALIIGFSVLRA